jgi:hypothetical protein
MLAQDVCRIAVTRHVVHAQNPGCMRRSCLMVGQGIVSLLQSCVWGACRVDHGLVVPEYHCRSFDGDSKVTKGKSEGNDLFCACLGCDILRAEGC